MFDKNTDRDWQLVGESDPYYGVLTFDQYKSSRLTPEALQHFFITGEKYVDDILTIIHEKIDSEFIPKQSLDFGCGVGRILIPLSKKVEFITGVDVSDGMLKEAARNCLLQNIDNVEFIQSNGTSIGVKKNFNFIHSFIVFQHIPVKRGTRLFEELIDHIDENGVGVVHFTFYRKASAINQFFYNIIKRSRILSIAWNILRSRKISEPVFQMNMYSTNHLLRILEEKNCHNIHIRFTKHIGIYYGILLFFQKKQNTMSGVE